MDIKKSLIFLSLALAIMMVDLDITAVNLALADIAKELMINMSTAQWIIDGYMIAAASLTALGGRLCDIYGTKRIFIFGLVMFTISSLAVGLSIDAWTVLVSRVIQGACIAFTFPVAMVIVREAYPEETQGTMIGLLIAIAGLSQALGPTVGGLIIYAINWRWIFFLDVPLALLALWIAISYLPKTTGTCTKEAVDWKSATLLSVGLLSIMTALNQVQLFGLLSTRFIGLVVIGGIFLFTFTHSEYRTSRPLLALHLLMNKNFLIVNTVRMLFNFIYFAMLFMLGLLLQNIFDYTPLHSGYILLAMTLTFGVLSIFTGQWVDKIGVKTPIMLGFLLLAISNVCFALVEQHNNLIFVLISLFIAGIAIALLVPATGAAALFSVDRENSGAAMGVFTTNAFIGGAIGVAIAGFLLAHSGDEMLNVFIREGITLPSTITVHHLEQIASGVVPISSISQLVSADLLHRITQMIHSAFLSGFSLMMWICVGLSVFSFLLMLFLQLPQMGKQSQ